LGDAIARMAGDATLRADSGALARRRAVERYGAERLLGDTDALYRELLA
jgi:glycosyltransferase involved in cell wall biosynthesis